MHCLNSFFNFFYHMTLCQCGIC